MAGVGTGYGLELFGSGDRHFVVDRERGLLRFGNGLTGRVPRLTTSVANTVKVQYSVGGGAIGNVGEGLHWSADNDDFQAINVVAAEGGAESETIAAARDRAFSYLRRQESPLRDATMRNRRGRYPA